MKKNSILLIMGFVILAGLYFFFSQGTGDDPRKVMVFPGGNSRETYFTLHHIKEAQSISKGKGCKVGILDHSFGTALHPDLYAGGKNFVEGNDEFLTDREWHGYWMANVLHEVAPEAEIYALNIRSFEGQAEDADAMAAAIDWAIEQQYNILTYSNESLEGEPGKVLGAALERAHKAGIVTTFINTTHQGNIMPSGLWGDTDASRESDVNILQYDYSVVFIEEYQKMKITAETRDKPFFSVSSMSQVLGGVVAMMKSLHPALTPDQCKTILRETSHPMDYHGEKPPRVLDALAAVTRVQKMQ